MRMRTVLEGIGAALLLLLPYFCKFLLPSNLVLYHLRLPVTNLIGGLLVDLLAYSVFVTGLLVALRYLPTHVQRIAGTVFAGLMVWVAADFAFEVLIHLDYRIGHLGKVWGQCAVGVCLLSGALAHFFPRGSQLAVRAVRVSLAAVAFSALWIVPQLLHLALIRPAGESAGPNQQLSSTGSSSNRRIVWILFDELSYHQTFDHPVSGIELPNFDRLHAQSISFSNLRPAGSFTELIIPSLFLGRRIDRTRSTLEGKLFYKNESDRSWLAYDPNATLFGLARRNGWSTGIDGWYNPYCRDLAPVLDVCRWEPDMLPIQVFGASEDKSVLANAAVLPRHFLTLAPQAATPAERHAQIYRSIMAHAQTLIDDRSLRFVFLHIPVPHGPAIYDRQHHRLRTGGTYLDSLVLADDTLGRLLQELLASPSSDRTTVVVSSDHSWRIYLSRYGDAWADEEERACGGRFDDRPVLLIHFPNEQQGVDVSAAVPEMLEHDMIAGMLRGQIGKPEDLASFLSHNSR
jgi:Sulfatase